MVRWELKWNSERKELSKSAEQSAVRRRIRRRFSAAEPRRRLSSARLSRSPVEFALSSALAYLFCSCLRVAVQWVSNGGVWLQRRLALCGSLRVRPGRCASLLRPMSLCLCLREAEVLFGNANSLGAMSLGLHTWRGALCSASFASVSLSSGVSLMSRVETNCEIAPLLDHEQQQQRRRPSPAGGSIVRARTAAGGVKQSDA